MAGASVEVEMSAASEFGMEMAFGGWNVEEVESDGWVDRDDGVERFGEVLEVEGPAVGRVRVDQLDPGGDFWRESSSCE